MFMLQHLPAKEARSICLLSVSLELIHIGVSVSDPGDLIKDRQPSLYLIVKSYKNRHLYKLNVIVSISFLNLFQFNSKR